jgi:EAL domain-containing protein (putative c-di-GMP-specific phosphodiesterase class I)
MPNAKAQTMPAESTLLDLILQPGSLSVVFQPIFEVGADTPVLFGLECLIRGPRGSNAQRPAVLFEYVRRKRAEASTDRACVASALGEAAGLPTVPRLFVLSHAEKAGIEATRLVVEIVEHAPPLDVPGFRRALEELREAGLAIALDDVGLGQSNYKMILDVRPDIYKLDRYLVAGAFNDPYRQIILDSLARMVRRLEGRAVAEGVEDSHELVAVQSAGIEFVQGYYFARPMPRDELLASGFLAGRVPAYGVM